MAMSLQRELPKKELLSKLTMRNYSEDAHDDRVQNHLDATRAIADETGHANMRRVMAVLES